jgi:hypothetical protein
MIINFKTYIIDIQKQKREREREFPRTFVSPTFTTTMIDDHKEHLATFEHMIQKSTTRNAYSFLFIIEKVRRQFGTHYWAHKIFQWKH